MSLRFKAVLVALLAFAAPLQAQAAEDERWPWYGEWERARFEAFSPLVQSLIKRDEAEAVRLVEAGASLDDKVSSHEIRRMAEPQVKVAYAGGEPERDYPVVILAALADLPRVVAAIGRRAPAALAATDPDGNTALAWASRSGHAEMVRLLLDQGGDPLQRDRNNHTPLSLAVRRKQAGVTRLLIAAIPRGQYAEIGVVDQVWLASYGGDTATTRALVEAGVPPDYVAPQGNTALISAVMDSDLERVRLLLDRGAVVHLHRYRGETIFDRAEANLASDTQDAREIHRLIHAASRREGGWTKSAETELTEELMKLLNPPRH